MRLHKTGHIIADTVSDLIGELPDGNYKIAYGILRHAQFAGHDAWFELDKGYWGPKHFDGLYRLSYRGTQGRYSPDAPHKPHRLTLEPWKTERGHQVLICPPTNEVCKFFGVNLPTWIFTAVADCKGQAYAIRYKGMPEPVPVNWDIVDRIVTFNSTIGIEALRRGIPVISDPEHSSIGSYTKFINRLDGFDRDPLFSFLDGHQFHLHERERIWLLIKHYLQS